jgi:hypothetical protein
MSQGTMMKDVTGFSPERVGVVQLWQQLTGSSLSPVIFKLFHNEAGTDPEHQSNRRVLHGTFTTGLQNKQRRSSPATADTSRPITAKRTNMFRQMRCRCDDISATQSSTFRLANTRETAI